VYCPTGDISQSLDLFDDAKLGSVTAIQKRRNDNQSQIGPPLKKLSLSDAHFATKGDRILLWDGVAGRHKIHALPRVVARLVPHSCYWVSIVASVFTARAPLSNGLPCGRHLPITFVNSIAFSQKIRTTVRMQLSPVDFKKYCWVELSQGPAGTF
jgi:hypothetical protein